MKRPPYLVHGDTIGIVPPAKVVNRTYIESSIKILESWGFKIKLASNIYQSDFQFAGNDEERRTALQEMLDNDEIKAILCARGGYGTTRIIDRISLLKFVKFPKWVIGYSDITSLLIKIHNAGFECIHGPMPISMDAKKDLLSLNLLREILSGEPGQPYQFDSHPLNITGNAEGRIIGGNLTMLCNNIGTSTDFDAKNYILFLEDIDEYLYRIDRMMVQLKRSGKLNHLAGLMVGHMTDMKDNDDPFGKSSVEVILEHSKNQGYPVCFGAPAGHEFPNYPFIIGRNALLEINAGHTRLTLKNKTRYEPKQNKQPGGNTGKYQQNKCSNDKYGINEGNLDGPG